MSEAQDRPKAGWRPSRSFLGWHLPLSRPLGDESAKRARARGQEAVRTMGRFSELGRGLSVPARNRQEPEETKAKVRNVPRLLGQQPVLCQGRGAWAGRTAAAGA